MNGQSIVVFDGNDIGYLRWLARNSNGFVINTRRHPDPAYMVLHRASCYSIGRYTATSSPGAFTERSYIKVCAGSIGELCDWVRENGRADGSFSSECGFCRPHAYEPT